MAKPRSVRLSTGFEVALDGDLLAIIEALYQEVTLGSVLSSSFETMRSEILSLIDQMGATERRTYLAESLFLNSVTYENEMLSAYARRLGAKVSRRTGAGRAATGKGSTKKPR
jgi:predicted DNA-binding helix-hairpin-helix protein